MKHKIRIIVNWYFIGKTLKNYSNAFHSNLLSLLHDNMSRDMTKPTNWVCAQRRLRSAWASAQSDQSLRCPHEESLGPELHTERKAKTLIRLGGCPGWSESSLGAQPHCWFVMSQLILCFAILPRLKLYTFKIVYSEPCHEKTCLEGFRPGKSQTGLLSYRD